MNFPYSRRQGGPKADVPPPPPPAAPPPPPPGPPLPHPQRATPFPARPQPQIPIPPPPPPAPPPPPRAPAVAAPAVAGARSARPLAGLLKSADISSPAPSALRRRSPPSIAVHRRGRRALLDSIGQNPSLHQQHLPVRHPTSTLDWDPSGPFGRRLLPLPPPAPLPQPLAAAPPTAHQSPFLAMTSSTTTPANISLTRPYLSEPPSARPLLYRCPLPPHPPPDRALDLSP